MRPDGAEFVQRGAFTSWQRPIGSGRRLGRRRRPVHLGRSWATGRLPPGQWRPAAPRTPPAASWVRAANSSVHSPRALAPPCTPMAHSWGSWAASNSWQRGVGSGRRPARRRRAGPGANKAGQQAAASSALPSARWRRPVARGRCAGRRRAGRWWRLGPGAGEAWQQAAASFKPSSTGWQRFVGRGRRPARRHPGSWWPASRLTATASLRPDATPCDCMARSWAAATGWRCSLGRGRRAARRRAARRWRAGPSASDAG